MRSTGTFAAALLLALSSIASLAGCADAASGEDFDASEGSLVGSRHGDGRVDEDAVQLATRLAASDEEPGRYLGAIPTGARGLDWQMGVTFDEATGRWALVFDLVGRDGRQERIVRVDGKATPADDTTTPKYAGAIASATATTADQLRASYDKFLGALDRHRASRGTPPSGVRPLAVPPAPSAAVDDVASEGAADGAGGPGLCVIGAGAAAQLSAFVAVTGLVAIVTGGAGLAAFALVGGGSASTVASVLAMDSLCER